MKSDWEKIFSQNMEAMEFPGRETPFYKPKGNKGSVWIITEQSEYPMVPPPMDRHDMVAGGGHELDLDISDPYFLVVHKVIGLCEYTHCIPWAKIVDVVFFQMST